jgi:acetyltransferase-like isoleucine patch superfamily enzyme
MRRSSHGGGGCPETGWVGLRILASATPLRAGMGACPTPPVVIPWTHRPTRDIVPLRVHRRLPGSSTISHLADLVITVAKARQAVWARLAMRRCDEVGALTRLQGRLVLRNCGTIRIGSRVRFCAEPTPIELCAMPGGELVIGDGTFINRGVCLCARKSIRIGRDCAIGNDVLVLDSDFHQVGRHNDLGSDVPAAIVIGDGVWLASRSVVLKGVCIGDGAVVCAGAVVVKSVPPYTMVGGTPARPIRRLTAAEGAPEPRAVVAIAAGQDGV